MDAMTINVEAAHGNDNAAARDASARELAHHIKNVIGVSTQIAVRDIGGIERSFGKAKRVVDNRPKE
jgi:phenylacetate-CoA ligase